MTQNEQQEIRPESALPAKQPVVRPAPMQMDDKGLYVLANQHDEWRLAKMLIDSGAVNPSLKDPLHVMVAMQSAKSLKLNPYTALRQMAFINGSLTFFGDLELAVVRMSGQVEMIEEWHFCLDENGEYKRRCYENSNLHLPAFGAMCVIKRKGMPAGAESFTKSDAMTAGLWERTPVWKKFPSRMLQMRARSVALKNHFSDCLQGVTSIEYEFEGCERIDSNVADNRNKSLER